MNTDAQSLLSSIAAKKITLGQKTTYGLGAGGDPEVGFEAAQESRDDIRSAVEGANIVFLCAGLGGGTASGVVPILAQTARETGAVVFSIVTSPFSFEGRRRSKQSAEALALLSKQSNALIHFENDRMADISSARSGIEETFAAANSMLCACVGSLIAILQGGSPMPIGLADLLAAVGGGGPAGLVRTRRGHRRQPGSRSSRARLEEPSARSRTPHRRMPRRYRTPGRASLALVFGSRRRDARGETAHR